MRLTVLGCHGGQLPGCRTTCFLLDGRVTVDAGALTSTLPLEELLSLEDVFLTHSHFDHVKDVPLLVDLSVGRRSQPLRVHGPKGCIDTLSDSLFNDRLWPDFTRIPSTEAPVISLHPLTSYHPVKAGELTFLPVPVSHPVDSVGYLIEKAGRSIAFSGDTGPTTELWEEVNRRKGLKAVFLEVSFPNRMAGLAEVSGHHTPATLALELEKLHADVPVFLYHLKPAFLDELRQELEALRNPLLRILELGDTFEF